MDRSTVVIELESDALAARDLAAGGVFVTDCLLRLGEECDLVVCGANHQIWLPARAVYVDEHGGAGLELIGFSSEVKAQLAELEPFEQPRVVDDDEPPPGDELDGSVREPPAGPDDLIVREGHELVALIDLEALADANEEDHEDEDDLAIPISANEAEDGEAEPQDRADDGADPYDRTDDDPDAPSTAANRLARNVHERLRGLNLAAQIKLAAAGELHERIVLERLYGKNVWETLLRNPRLSAPEVSRIARYGSLPRVMLEVIVANNAWLQVPEVRRALLSNPRLATDQIMKVLRLTPKHELKLASVQTAYPQAVRTAAKRLLRGA